MRSRRVGMRAPSAAPSQHGGTALVETLAAVTIIAIAGAGLAATATVAAVHTRLEREISAALWLALGRLEAQRGYPRGSGTERIVLAEGTTIVGVWTHDDGRGLPDRVSITTSWRGHTLTLDAGVWP